MRGALPLVLLVLLLSVPTAAADVRIREVHPNARTGWDTEVVVLQATGSEATRLDGWRLTDGEATIELRGRVGPDDPLHVVENRSQVRRWVPDLPADAVPYQGRFKLADTGDHVTLVAPDGRVRDSVYYGAVAAGPGWLGRPVPAPGSGRILVRRGDDTDRAGDFEGRRTHRLGQTRVETSWRRGNVTLFAAPDRSYAAATRFLDRTERDLDLTLYEFTHPGLARHVLDALDRGVDVDLLLEGGPVGWNFTMPEPDPHLEPERWHVWRAAQRQLWVADRLQDAGATVRRLGNGRYRWTHAKAAAGDGRVLVTTENWGLTGFPEDPSWGNRGWGAVVDHGGVASRLRDVIEDDMRLERADVRPHRLEPADSFTSGYDAPSGNVTSSFDRYNASRVPVRLVVGPDQAWTVLDRIAEAESRVRVQALDLNVAGRDGRPFREALTRAAEGGADVDVIVNDNPVYDADQVQRVADVLEPAGVEVAGLRAGAPFVNLHAKVAVVDDTVYVGSANFNRNAFTDNREVGVLVRDAGAADWMARVFAHDWRRARQVDAARSRVPIQLGVAAVAIGVTIALYTRLAT